MLCKMAIRDGMLGNSVSSTFHASTYAEIHKNRVRKNVVLLQYRFCFPWMLGLSLKRQNVRTSCCCTHPDAVEPQ